MKQVWILIGRLAYILAWPVFHFYLKDSQRTRVVVEAQGKVLVVKDWLGDGHWKLPGGGIHEGEAAIDSAVRELQEETGLVAKAKQLKLLGTIEAGGHGNKIKLHIFNLKLAEPVAVTKQKFEIISIGWESIAELQKRPNLSNTARRAFDLLNN